MTPLLFRQPVPDCCGDDCQHPLVLGDVLGLGFAGDQRSHVAGDAERFDGALGRGHAGNDSTGAAERVLVSVLSSKQGSRECNPQPSTHGGSVR